MFFDEPSLVLTHGLFSVLFLVVGCMVCESFPVTLRLFSCSVTRTTLVLDTRFALLRLFF